MIKHLNTLKVEINPAFKSEFAEWQADFNKEIAAFKGFLSLEILHEATGAVNEWSLIERFSNEASLTLWKESLQRKELLLKLESYLKEGREILEGNPSSTGLSFGVTEVFVTEVNPEHIAEYRKWIAKIHKAEASFPGFAGMYVQAPSSNKKNWITLLQFDSEVNLENWLSSKIRKEILEEAKPLIGSLESHRVITPYAGWFSSFAKNPAIPPVWKQTMLVLLVLFPIVMLEIKFLMPKLASLNLSLATFIGNLISVSLISWPMMPLAIFCLRFWLSHDKQSLRHNLFGALLVIAFYIIEIALFWI